MGFRGAAEVGFRGAATLTEHLSALSFPAVPRGPIWQGGVSRGGAQMCYFWPFWSFHCKNTPKVGVYREKFNIKNVAQIFFGGFFICWDHVISFLQQVLPYWHY